MKNKNKIAIADSGPIFNIYKTIKELCGPIMFIDILFLMNRIF